MERRIKENSIKALIYALLFVMMMVESFFVEPSVNTTDGTQKADTLLAPVQTQWTR